MERWYMLGLFEVFMILQDLGNMFFRAVRVVVIRKSSFKNNIRKMHVETVYIQNISPDQIRRKIFWRYANWNMTQLDLSVNFLFTFLKGTRSILIKFAKICVKEGWGMNRLMKIICEISCKQVKFKIFDLCRRTILSERSF